MNLGAANQQLACKISLLSFKYSTSSLKLEPRGSESEPELIFSMKFFSREPELLRSCVERCDASLGELSEGGSDRTRFLTDAASFFL